MKYLVKPEIIKEVRKNTVIVQNIQVDEPTTGSGIIISSKNVLTATHCLGGKTYIVKDQKKYEVIDACPTLPSCGISLLTLKEPVFHQPTIKICENVEIGEILFWTTLAFGKIQEATFYGHLAASVRQKDDLTYYYICGDFCHGMSGSGIYNHKGELVGMLVMIEQSNNEFEKLVLGLAIPVRYFMPLIAITRDDLLVKPKSKKSV